MIDRSLLRQTVLGNTPPASIEQVSAHVYKVTLSDGLEVALKRVADPPSLSTESLVLERLHRLGCPVPEVHLVEPSLRILVTAWAGDRTMDDVCQEEDPETAAQRGGDVAEGLCRIEAAAKGLDEGLLLRPDAEDEAAGILREARCGAEALLRGDARPLAEAQGALTRTAERLRAGTRAVASLDYNARNVVIDRGGAARFIDFSSVGWDWPERRFIQYVTGLGAYRKGGRLVSPLTPELAALYARRRRRFSPEAGEEAVLRAVDAHDLLFHLVILARLARLRRCPETPAARLLRRAWDAPEARWRQALLHLGRPLSDDPDVSALRDLFRRHSRIAPDDPSSEK
ncbi:hypothetical protein HYY27_08200 [bacterium]|nr:hypothetical protein [bacterium]